MSNKDLLIIGLGNPGSQYLLHRHNIGFILADFLIESLRLPAYKSKFDCLYSSGDHAGKKIIIAKPMKFMNLSGDAVIQIAKFYKINVENILVLHDEIDLPFGVIKLKKSGGTAGHNGLKSIMNHLGANFYRLRFGVGRPALKAEVTNYVLNNFKKTELEWIEENISFICDIILDNNLAIEKTNQELGKISP